MNQRWLDTGSFSNLPIPDANFLVKNNKGFAVIDLETTGFHATTDKIVEIGVVLLDQFLQPTHAIQTLVNPERTMDATHIHKISDSDVAKAPTLSKIINSLFALLNGRILVAHNAQFEQAFLYEGFTSANVFSTPFLSPEVNLDTIKIAPNLLHTANTKLGTLAQAIGIVIDKPHIALNDALATAKLLQFALPKWGNYNVKLDKAYSTRYDMTSYEAVISDELSLWIDRENIHLTQPRGSYETEALKLQGGSRNAMVKQQLQYLQLLNKSLVVPQLTPYEMDRLFTYALENNFTQEDVTWLAFDYLQIDRHRKGDSDKQWERISTLIEVFCINDALAMLQHQEQELSDKRLIEMIKTIPLFSEGDRIAFTGATRFDRTQWEHHLETSGFTSGGVTMKTKFLVTNSDISNTSSKITKALQYSIPIIKEHEIEHYCGVPAGEPTPSTGKWRY